MDEYYKSELLRCETDIDGTLRRLSGNEELYIKCLEMFLEDTSMAVLEQALQNRSWEDSLAAAHALKGVSGNMGLMPVFKASSKLVTLIRAGRTKELDASFSELRECYDELYDVISRCSREAKKAQLSRDAER